MIRWYAYRSKAGTDTTIARSMHDLRRAASFIDELRREGCTAVAMGSTPETASARSAAMLCRGCERGAGDLCGECRDAVLVPALVASVAVCGTKRKVA